MTQHLEFKTRVGVPQKYPELRTLSITVYKGGHHYSSPDIVFRWTLNTDKPVSEGWYGVLLEIEAVSKSHLETLVALARRVIGRPEKDYEAFNPHEIVARLRKIKATEIVYDSRLMDYVPLAEMADPDCERWSEDEEALGANSFFAGVMARTEWEAKQLVAERFNQIYRSEESEAQFAAWLLSDRPVKVRPRTSAFGTTELDYRTAEEKIAEAEAECAPKPETDESRPGFMANDDEQELPYIDKPEEASDG